MDKTIKYVDNVNFTQKTDSKEPEKVDWLRKLEETYGKDINGEGFNVEKYEEKKDLRQIFNE